ncbi:hypothetical protein D3C87_1274460 [compost metagenome]
MQSQAGNFASFFVLKVSIGAQLPDIGMILAMAKFFPQFVYVKSRFDFFDMIRFFEITIRTS